MATPSHTQVGRRLPYGGCSQFTLEKWLSVYVSIGEKQTKCIAHWEVLSVRKKSAGSSSQQNQPMAGFCCCLRNSFSATILSLPGWQGLSVREGICLNHDPVVCVLYAHWAVLILPQSGAVLNPTPFYPNSWKSTAAGLLLELWRWVLSRHLGWTSTNHSFLLAQDDGYKT